MIADVAGVDGAVESNQETEARRNRERFSFLKWASRSFQNVEIVPPGGGICHQLNIERFCKVVTTDALADGDVACFDSLVGTDSHTTTANGLGVLGWGVGGIEAEAGMLGQPATFMVPEVVGVHLTGHLAPGVTSTDLVLHITELLRRTQVVGKFVEFYGPGAKALSLPDRATIGNMAPEYGATMGFFGVDEVTTAYLAGTGRPAELCATVENYYRAQEMWGIPTKRDALDFTSIVDLDLGNVQPCVAGPKRPQDRIPIQELRKTWLELLAAPAPAGYGKQPVPGSREPLNLPPTLDSEPDEIALVGQLFGARAGVFTVDDPDPAYPLWEVKVDSKGGVTDTIRHGSVVIAAITSCTNTSNPSVMLAAGLLARKANQRGLTIKPSVKTSLAPGSRVVTDYLEKTGLQQDLDRLGFQTVGYGCTTCIGNSGPLDPGIEDVVRAEDVITAAVLSGNRNFEARIHQSVKANFLMSPPLVVAFAIAGNVDVNLAIDPLGFDNDGQPVYLRDIWPSSTEIEEVLRSSLTPEVFQRLYSDFSAQNPRWNEIVTSCDLVYEWDRNSTYIQEPPFFDDFNSGPPEIGEIKNARALGIFSDSVTTDHISPAGAIRMDSPAGRYLTEHGVNFADFNSYGSRRGDDRVMTRGTFANVRIKNLMVPGSEGGVTRLNGETVSIYDAAAAHRAAGTPTIIIAGEDYGMGSSRDWAAKGSNLLGVKAVITKSFERIHRSNLVGMGVLPCTFANKEDYDKLTTQADATFDVLGVGNDVQPRQQAVLRVHPAGGEPFDIPIIVRIDTPVEKEYFLAGGILPYVLSQLIRDGERQG